MDFKLLGIFKLLGTWAGLGIVLRHYVKSSLTNGLRTSLRSISLRLSVLGTIWKSVYCTLLIGVVTALIPYNAVFALDIRSFGACQGAPDDSVAIQKAIDAALRSKTDNAVTFSCLAPVGKGVIARRATGKAAVSLRALPGGGIRAVKTFGKPSTLGAGSGGLAALVLRDCTDCSATGLTFDGNGKPIIMLGVVFSLRAIIKDNTFYNVGNPSGPPSALYAVGNRDNHYSNNTVRDTHGETRGLWIGNVGGGPSEIESNPTVSNNTLTNIARSAIVITAIGGRVSDNYVNVTGGAGIVLAAGSVGGTTNVVVEGNEIHRANYHAIQSDVWEDGYKTVGVIVKDNTCSESNHYGIYAVRVSDWVITGNSCMDNNYDNVGHGGGIYVQNAHNVTVANNRTMDTREGPHRTQDDGITLSAGLTEFDLRAITVTNNFAINNKMHGIHALTNPASPARPAFDIDIIFNTIERNGGCGLRINERSPKQLVGVSTSNNSLLNNATNRLCDNR